MIARWGAFLAGILSLSMLWSRDVSYATPVFLLGCVSLALLGYREAAAWRDLLNPLSVLLALCGLRFALPAFLIALYGEPDNDIVKLMSLEEFDWRMGQLLAMAGVSGVAFGWLVVPSRIDRAAVLSLRGPRGGFYVGIVSMCVGLISLFLFVGANAFVDEAIVAGAFRQTSVQAGTGQYFFLSLALTSGSVIASRYLLMNGSTTWGALVPAGIATLFFFILGGRVRAAAPLVATAVLIWYMRQESGGWGRARVGKTLAWVLLALVVATWFGHVGLLYRGGEGLSALGESLSLQSLSDYAEESVYVDVGQLHTLAGATALGGGAAGREGFVGALIWPVSDFLGQPFGGAGVFILEKTSGMEFVAGLHPSLIADAYLSYGFMGLVVVTVAFGAASKLWYVRFRSGAMDACLYVLGVIYLVRILLESVDKWGETLVVLLFTLATLVFARLLFGEGPRRHSDADGETLGTRPELEVLGR